MRVLITNRVLLNGSGTETVTRDLALELSKLGHEPIAYSPVLVSKVMKAGVRPSWLPWRTTW